MKLAQFHALCYREWEDGHGDVQSLHLTADSLRELSEDVLATGRFDETWLPSLELRVREEEATSLTRGAAITSVLNPVTRSEVKLWGSAESDAAGVYRLYQMVPLG